jgi:hypothetical protein
MYVSLSDWVAAGDLLFPCEHMNEINATLIPVARVVVMRSIYSRNYLAARNMKQNVHCSTSDINRRRLSAHA